MDIVTASPPVSPRVVAAILMIQKSKVTWGTLLHVSRARSFMSMPAWFIGEEALDPSHKPTTAAGGEAPHSLVRTCPTAARYAHPLRVSPSIVSLARIEYSRSDMPSLHAS